MTDFVGTESIFSGLSRLLISTGSTGQSPVNPRFTSLLRAINSSEEMKALARSFMATGGMFISSTEMSEGTDQYSGSFKQGSAGVPSTIRLPDDYYAVVGLPGSSSSGIAQNRTDRQVFAEQVRVLAHELSHASTSVQTYAIDNVAWNVALSSNRSGAAISNYVSSIVSAYAKDEASAYIRNWNLLARAGLSFEECLAAIPPNERVLARQYGQDPSTLSARPIESENPAVVSGYVNYVLGQKLGPSLPDYATYYSISALRALGRITTGGGFDLSQVLDLPGVTAQAIIQSDFRGTVRFRNPDVPGGYFEVSNGRLQGSAVPGSTTDYSIRAVNGSDSITYRREVTRAPTPGFLLEERVDVIIVKSGVTLYVPDIKLLGLSQQDLTALQRGAPDVVARVVSSERGVYVATIGEGGALTYNLENGNQVRVGPPRQIATSWQLQDQSATAIALAELAGTPESAAVIGSWGRILSGLGPGLSMSLDAEGSGTILDGNGVVVGTVSRSSEGVKLSLADGRTITIGADGSGSVMATAPGLTTTTWFDASGDPSHKETRSFDGGGSLVGIEVESATSWGGVSIEKRSPDGGLLQSTTRQTFDDGTVLETTQRPNGLGAIVAYDAKGGVVSTATLNVGEDGSAVMSTEVSGNAVDLRIKIENGSATLIGVSAINGESVSSDLVDAALAELALNAKDVLLARGDIGAVAELAGVNNPSNSGGWSPVSNGSGDAWYKSGLAQEIGGSLTSIQSLIAGIQSGKPLPIASAIFSLAAHLSRHQLFNEDGTPTLDEKGFAQFNGGDATLGYIASGFSGINSLIGLRTALDKGDPLAALSSGLSLTNTVLSTYQSVLAGQISTQYGGIAAARNAIDEGDELALQMIGEYDAVGSAIRDIGSILPWVSLFVALKNGDALSAIGAAAALLDIPYVGWVIAVYQILEVMFHDYDIEGAVEFHSTGDGRHVDPVLTIDSDGGGATLMSVTSAILDNLNKVLDGMPDQGLIASRLPKIKYVGHDGDGGEFILSWTDAKTGKTVTRTFDSNTKLQAVGSADNLARGDEGVLSHAGEIAYSDAFHWTLADAFFAAAEQSGAIAPVWEVNTIDKQFVPKPGTAGPGSDVPILQPTDPLAGKSTIERARANGQLLSYDPGDANARPAGAQQNFQPIVLTTDTDGYGHGLATVTPRDQAGGVLFDVDDDGYAEHTDWIGPLDGILVLDRNGDGRIAGGHELFSDSQVDMGPRGLHVLDEIDSNADGVIDRADPVYDHLRVWFDVNHNGVVDTNLGPNHISELQSMAEVNIRSLDINAGRYASGWISPLGNAVREGSLDAPTDPSGGFMVMPSLGADAAGVMTKSSGNSLLVVNETGGQNMMASALGNYANSKDPQPHTHLSSDGQLVAVDELADDVEDVAIVLSLEQLLKNDASAAAGLSITGVGAAQHGTVTLDSTSGTVRFTPAANFSGMASFSYTVSDSTGRQAQATAFVDVASVNDLPEARAEGALHRGTWADLIITGTQASVDSPALTFYRLPAGARTVASETVPASEVEQVGPVSIGTQRGVVGFRGGQMVWGANIVGYQSDNEILLPPTSWSPVEIVGFGDGHLAATDIETPTNLTYKLAVDARFGELSFDEQTGDWSYTQTETSGLDDSFIVRVTDAAGGSSLTTVHIDNEPLPQPYFLDSGGGGPGAGGGGPPIVLDLNGDGVKLSSVANSSAFFDFEGNGQRKVTGWVSPLDGLLAYDANGNGRIDGSAELSFISYVSGAHTDLEGLAAFDSNHDGKLSAADDQWSKFRIWRDADSDGEQDLGELLTPTQLGVASISLSSDGVSRDVQGNTVHGTGSFTRIDGSTGKLADVSFTTGTEVWRANTADEVTASESGGMLSTGTGDDRIHGSAASDTVDAGSGDDRIAAGAGDDVITAGVGNDIVSGEGGADIVYGGFGNDTIAGGDGSDQLHGSDGNDVLLGDAGDDLLTGDAGADQMQGGDGNDKMFGGAGSDTIIGGAGSDRLDGGTGSDTLEGDAGNDLFTIDSSLDKVLEGVDGGVDTVISSVSVSGLSNVEVIALAGSANLSATGTNASETIFGNSGDNVIDGADGADRMIGGAGNDTYVVDNASDVVVEDVEGAPASGSLLLNTDNSLAANPFNTYGHVAGGPASGGVDTVKASISWTLGANVENLTLAGNAAINGNGNELGNVIVGNLAANTISGGRGNDLLQGGGGLDTYTFARGDGSDRIDDVAGDGVIQFGPGVVWADLHVTTVGSDLVIELLQGGQPSSDKITLVGWVDADEHVGTVKFSDGSSHSLSIGAPPVQNQAPVAAADTAQIHQLAASVTGNVLTNDHDPDVGDTLHVSNPGTLHGTYGTLTLAADGSYGYAPDPSQAVKSLAKGQTVTDAFNYTVSDGNVTSPLTASSTLTIQVIGDNDAPVVEAPLADQTAKVNNAINVVLPATAFADVDQGDVLTWSAKLASGEALPNWLSFDPATRKLTGTAPYALGGQSVDIQVTATDTNGSSANDVFRLTLESGGSTLTGTPGVDNLVGTSLDDTLSGLGGNDRLAGGAGFDTYTFSRGDGVDQITDTEQGGRLLLGAGLTNADLKLIRIDNDGVVELLGAGQAPADRVVLKDWFAGVAAVDRVSRIDFADGQSLTLADTLFDQAPIAVDDSATGTEDIASIGGNVLANDRDPDAADTLKVANAGIYTGAWGRLDLAEGGSWVYTPGEQAQQLAAGTTVVEQFNVAISDRSGGVEGLGSSSVLTVTLTGTNDAPTVEGSIGDLSTSIRLPFTLQLPAGLFADIDTGDSLNLSVALVGGQALPSWITYDAAARTLTGTPPDAAGGLSMQIEVKATDAAGAQASTSFQLDVGTNGMVLVGTEGPDTLVGSELNDTLTGLGGSDVLKGGGGADKMTGGTGDDRYAVDDPLDVVTEDANAGIDTIEASIAMLLGNNVENLMLIGSDAIDGTGNALDNVLVGNAAVNRLLGLAGNDVLAGGQGDDVLDGGSGDDLYLYNQGEGRDVMTDASGTDTLRFGPGITIDSVVARSLTVNGQAKVFISILGVDGTEQADQGIEIAPTGGIERFQFADGSVRTLADLMSSTRTLNGGNGNDTLTGDRRDDTINGSNGNDILYGRSGNDILDGGNGTDKLFGEGGNDTLRGNNDADELWGGSGDDALDGSNGADLLVGGMGNDLLTGGNDSDRLDGGDGNDVLDGFNGLDDLYAGAGNDSLDGGNDNDVLAAGAGDDTISAGNGRDAVIAGTGNDVIDTSNDNDFVDAGAGADAISTGNGADFIAAGKGNDTIDAGQDQDFLAFNRGDGADTVLTSSWQRDTLSLGGGIRFADLKLSKNGNDLVLALGAGDSVTFKDWYKDTTRHNLTTLQVVTAVAGGDYNAASADRLLNQKVVGFNFEALATRFDQWRAANPSQTEWAFAGELNTYYLSGSNTKAIGGDLAWRYATTGSYGDIDARGVIDRISSMSATNWQTFTSSSGTIDPWTALQAGTLLLSDPTIGLPSPITPMSSPSSNELFFAAVNGGGHKPDWVGGTASAVIP